MLVLTKRANVCVFERVLRIGDVSCGRDTETFDKRKYWTWSKISGTLELSVTYRDSFWRKLVDKYRGRDGDVQGTWRRKFGTHMYMGPLGGAQFLCGLEFCSGEGVWKFLGVSVSGSNFGDARAPTFPTTYRDV